MIDEFEKKISRYIDGYTILTPDDRILAGLSGGADSVALVAVLSALGYDVLASHCNFHLRGEESDRDERFCRELCADLGIPLEVKHFNVKPYQEKYGVSVEMACRDLRYAWWHALTDDDLDTVIAVGHHREDNVETVLLNLLRGSGLKGLKGMLPYSRDMIARPLLDVTREEIEAYLHRRGLTWVDDSTNAGTEYKRNRLRNIIIPALEEAFPGATDGILRSIHCLRGNYGLYIDFVAYARNKYCGHDGSIDVGRIIADHGCNSETMLYEIISLTGGNMTTAANIVRSALAEGDSMPSGRKFTIGRKEFTLDRGKLYPEPAAPPEIPGVEFAHISREEFEALLRSGRLGKDVLCLDGAALHRNPDWEVRTWRKGDRIQPFGMTGGSRLVSDIFTDAKIPLTQKERIPLLTRNGIVLWVHGLRASCHYPVTPASRDIIKVVLNNHEK